MERFEPQPRRLDGSNRATRPCRRQDAPILSNTVRYFFLMLSGTFSKLYFFQSCYQVLFSTLFGFFQPCQFLFYAVGNLFSKLSGTFFNAVKYFFQCCQVLFSMLSGTFFNTAGTFSTLSGTFFTLSGTFFNTAGTFFNTVRYFSPHCLVFY